MMITVMILSLRTDRPGQTVQTQIRLLLVYTVCNFGCIFWVHYSSVKPSCLNFRVITANVLGVRIFRKFTVSYCNDAGDRTDWSAQTVSMFLLGPIWGRNSAPFPMQKSIFYSQLMRKISQFENFEKQG